MVISPEKHVRLRLVTAPNVARLIGFQCYPLAVPKTNAALPFVIYRRQNIVREPHLAGPNFKPLVMLQISCWAQFYDDARELGDEVRIALDGHIGALAGATIEDMRLTAETDDYIDPVSSGTQLPPAYEVRQIYQIRWQEATE
jgi:hypothetical protein